MSYLSVLVTIIFYQRLLEKQENEYAGKKLDSQLEDMQRDMERIDDMYENMRAMRHDMGNHLTVIKGLAESGKNDELAEYIAG